MAELSATAQQPRQFSWHHLVASSFNIIMDWNLKGFWIAPKIGSGKLKCLGGCTESCDVTIGNNTVLGVAKETALREFEAESGNSRNVLFFHEKLNFEHTVGKRERLQKQCYSTAFASAKFRTDLPREEGSEMGAPIIATFAEVLMGECAAGKFIPMHHEAHLRALPRFLELLEEAENGTDDQAAAKKFADARLHLETEIAFALEKMRLPSLDAYADLVNDEARRRIR
jgi:hypothetical protein